MKKREKVFMMEKREEMSGEGVLWEEVLINRLKEFFYWLGY